VRRLALALGVALAWLAAAAADAEPRLAVWAWERPEDLRFLPNGVEAAAQSGFVVLTGDGVFARARRFPLRMAGEPTTAVVHVQIDPRRRLVWSPRQRAEAAQAVLALARQPWARRVQVDFEVRRSQRQVLLDLLGDVRAGLPRGMPLSMTAIASWCETETWLNRAPVDEIVPMLFRMGSGGVGLRAKLAAGGDFALPACRSAYAVSTDERLVRAPAGRRIYLFSPRSWTAQSFETLRRRIGRWPGEGG
jgi:hypothetical protein